jgi:hypothetical protein
LEIRLLRIYLAEETEGTEGWRNCILSSFINCCEIKSRRIGSAELAVRMGEKRNPFRITVWKPEGGKAALKIWAQMGG